MLAVPVKLKKLNHPSVSFLWTPYIFLTADHGSDIIEGDLAFSVAFFNASNFNNTEEFEFTSYFCAGAILSQQILISSADCFRYKY